MKRHSVSVTETGTLFSALRRALPLLPEFALREALKKRDILLNGQRLSANVQVKQGDEVILYTPYDEMEMPIVYEDGRCLIVNKPAGINSDDNARGALSLISWAADRSHGQYVPQLCHRLDNRTSGLVIIAKDQEAFDSIKEAIVSRELIKVYECLVAGNPKPPEHTDTAWLLKDAIMARVHVSKTFHEGAKKIVTQYRVLQAGAVSRLEVTLHTGRTHQIRAHLAYLGYPVLGDDVYGNRDANRAVKMPGLMLCAARLAFKNLDGLPGLSGKQFSIDPTF